MGRDQKGRSKGVGRAKKGTLGRKPLDLKVMRKLLSLDIISANLIHLSIKMTTPHQLGALFVGERVFQNQGVFWQAFPSFPSPTPCLPPFWSRPIFHVARM